MPEPNWYDNATNLHTLCRFLVDHQDYDRFDLLHVLARAWHWEAEYAAEEELRRVQFS
jgi:hypothetical protein